MIYTIVNNGEEPVPVWMYDALAFFCEQASNVLYQQSVNLLELAELCERADKLEQESKVLYLKTICVFRELMRQNPQLKELREIVLNMERDADVLGLETKDIISQITSLENNTPTLS
jgi:hypothetical protein